MSNHWGYVCRSHDPEIESEHWFDRGAGVLAEVCQKVRAGEWPDGVASPDGCYRTAEPILWLRQHPKCDVALRSEYGDTREIAGAR